MKRFLALTLCALLLFSASADIPAPPKPVENPQAVAENALMLMTLLCACPSFMSFEGEPPEALRREAYDNFPLFAEEGWTEEARGQLFADGLAPLAEAMPSTAPYIPTALEIDSVFDTGVGTVRVCVLARQDFGAGMEFSFAAEFTLRPDPDACFGARVERVFIPD